MLPQEGNLGFLLLNIFDQEIIFLGNIVKSREFLSLSIFTFRMLEDPNNILNINCVDPLGLGDTPFMILTENMNFRRTALLMAIDNENMEMLELLLENKVNKIFKSRFPYPSQC